VGRAEVAAAVVGWPGRRLARTFGAGLRWAVLANDRDRRADGHRLSFSREHRLENAVDGRRHVGVDLVGGDLEQRLVAGDALARLLQPADDRAFGQRLAHLRHDDLGHA
jgi:hypothetical protein